MEGFKKLPKMQSFKTGGSVKPKAMCYGGKMKKGGEVDAADIKQDKAIVKKAIKMHDSQEHKGEHTDLSKLRKGGRTKKAAGTVKKFKAGGEVTNVYEAKKSSGDLDNIRKTKLIKPAKADAPSKASVKAKGTGAKTSKPAGDKDLIKKVKPTGDKKAAAKSGAKGPDAFKCGGKVVKKMAEGKMVKQAGATEAQDKYYQANMKKADMKQKAADYDAFGSRGDAAKKGMEESRMDALGNQYKKGGKAKVKKYADGGAVFSDEENKWLGGADRTDPIILERMRQAIGGKKPTVAPQGNYIPNANPAMDNRDIGMTGGNIDDESKWGNVSPAAAAFNKNIPGAGMSTPAAAPSAPVRQTARPSYMPNANPAMDNRDVGMVNQAPNVEQDSGLAYPQGRAKPFIDIPQNNPGMRQFNQQATSPAGNFWRWLTTNQSQRNKRGG